MIAKRDCTPFSLYVPTSAGCQREDHSRKAGGRRQQLPRTAAERREDRPRAVHRDSGGRAMALGEQGGAGERSPRDRGRQGGPPGLARLVREIRKIAEV